MIRKGIAVQELITELEKFNPRAQVSILAYGSIHPFEIVYGHNGDESFDGLVTPETCNQISFYLKDLDKKGVG